jgi:heme/copper-type cytochrome/quinol oxidase subunit 2
LQKALEESSEVVATNLKRIVVAYTTPLAMFFRQDLEEDDETDDDNNNNTSNNNNNMLWWILIPALCVVAIAGVIGVFVYRKRSQQKTYGILGKIDDNLLLSTDE